MTQRDWPVDEEIEISVAMAHAGGSLIADFFSHPSKKTSVQWEAELAAAVYRAMRSIDVAELRYIAATS